MKSGASSTVTPGISPTVSSSLAAGEDLAVHLLQELVDARPGHEVRAAVAERLTGIGTPSGSAGSLEMKLMTSIRKPSTPRSSQQRIIA